jgi:hypothetical protein
VEGGGGGQGERGLLLIGALLRGSGQQRSPPLVVRAISLLGVLGMIDGGLLPPVARVGVLRVQRRNRPLWGLCGLPLRRKELPPSGIFFNLFLLGSMGLPIEVDYLVV